MDEEADGVRPEEVPPCAEAEETRRPVDVVLSEAGGVRLAGAAEVPRLSCPDVFRETDEDVCLEEDSLRDVEAAAEVRREDEDTCPDEDVP